MSKKTKIIPSGYQIVVTSWENDADNYNTETISGLTLEQVMFYKDIASLMDDSDKFGNMYEPSDEEIANFDEALLEVFNNHKHLGMTIFTKDYEFDINNNEDIIEVMYEIKNEMGLSQGEFFTRVTDKITINLFDEDVYATKIM